MKFSSAALTIIVLLVTTSCWAQQQTQPSKSERALQQMHEHIRALNELEFRSAFKVVDKALGQNRTGTVHYQIRQPNLLRVTAKFSNKAIVVVSDGTKLFIHEPNRRRYRELDAKDSILGSLYTAAGLLGAQVRMIDFFWSVDYLAVGGESGVIGDLDARTFDKRPCDGFRVRRGEDVWSVWVERTPNRIPCHIISQTTDGSALSTQTNTIEWNSEPKFTADTFRFTPPAGHKAE